jgi:mannose-6-phosphate isomerase-like protein (cupin superfamily)
MGEGMLRKGTELSWQAKMAIRGGQGPARSADYLAMGDMDGVLGAGRTTLEPGSSVGEHAHPNTEELYLILEGHGTGILDGERFPVGPGDLFVLKAGHSHGLVNEGTEPLVFFGLLTRQAAPKA